jgi:hypothetical protein
MQTPMLSQILQPKRTSSSIVYLPNELIYARFRKWILIYMCVGYGTSTHTHMHTCVGVCAHTHTQQASEQQQIIYGSLIGSYDGEA